MRLLLVLFVTGLLWLLVSGCSDKQKDAARTEQELKELESAEDSLASATDTPILAETIPEPTQAADAGEAMAQADPAAVPPESRPAVETARPSTPPAAESQPEPKTEMPPVPAGIGYTVQIASCESEDYARKLVAQYTDRGYQPFVGTVSYNNQTYYRVRIGKFPTVAEAKGLRDELADRYSIQPWIDLME